jgi:hypothetical protein
MNKQEVISEIENMPYVSITQMGKRKFIELIQEIDEPEKVKIPQFVADIIEEYKKQNAPIIDIFTEKYSDDQYNTWLTRSPNAYNRVARAWLDGYEVEKEKRYLVKIKGVNEEFEYLVFGELSNTWKFRSLGSFGELKKHHTRKELEQANFGWVFDCPGIEVEEVQDD